jgi:hypothetical protein
MIKVNIVYEASKVIDSRNKMALNRRVKTALNNR